MIRIKPGNKLNGEINLSGAKNASLPIVVAAALTGKGTKLHNVPVELKDIQVLIKIMSEVGVSMHTEGHTLIIDDVNISASLVSGDAGKIRSSLILLPVISTLYGSCEIPVPGGCKLGERKYDILLDTLEKMGAEVSPNDEAIKVSCKDGYHGVDTTFHIASTIGSENAILAAALSKGKTIVRNANTRPEVIDLINFLNKAGAKITYKTRYIEIEGVDTLHPCEYSIMTDRHEALSYAILAAMHRSEIKINNFNLQNVQEDVELLRRIGIEMFEWGGDVYVSAKDKKLKPFSMVTYPYPGINSDMQPLFAALAATIEGESIITDTRFTERFQYVDEFVKMGIDIVNYENCAIIQGGKKIKGTELMALDLRAGAAVTFLSTVADGSSTISNEYQVKRGYANIVENLASLGVDITDDED